MRASWIRQLLISLCIPIFFACAEAYDYAKPEEESQSPPENATRTERGLTCLAVISVLMVVSISWEHLQDYLEEESGEEFKPVLASLFEELTLTGFLGLSMTAIQETSLMEDVSDYFFDDETVVEELYEKIHLTIFGVTVSYLTVVVCVMFMAKREKLRMLHAESACSADPRKVVQEYYEWKKEKMESNGWWTPWPIYPTCDIQYDYHWLVMRYQFFKAVERTPGIRAEINNDTFDMAEYMSKYMIQALDHIVSIEWKTWVCVWVLCWTFYGLFEIMESDVFAWMVLLFGWAALFFSFWLGYHLQYVAEQLLPPDLIEEFIKEELEIKNGTFRPAASERTELRSDMKRPPRHRRFKSIDSPTQEIILPKTIEESFELIVNGKIPDPRFKQDLVDNEINNVFGGLFPCFSCCNSKSSSTDEIENTIGKKSSSLFLFKERGRHFYMFVIRFNMLLTAIYMSSFVFVWMRSIFCVAGSLQCYGSMLVVFFLPVTLIYYYRHLVRTFTFVTAVEDEIKQKHMINIIEDVVRNVKTRQCLRIVQLLTIMAQRQAKNSTEIAKFLKDFSSSKGDDSKGASKARAVYKNKHVFLEKKRHYQKVFNMFDADGSGSLEFPEMLKMLRILGIINQEDDAMAEQECKEIMADLDEDGDGDVTFDEFFNWVAMSDLIMKHKHFRHQLVQEIFDKIDVDGGGDIDADELKATLHKFDQKITANDISTIIKEVGRGKTVINKEDFHEFVEKYLG